MGKDESELVPMNKEPGYGGTDAEETKKPDIDISDLCCLRRWIPTYISYTCKAIAVIIA